MKRVLNAVALMACASAFFGIRPALERNSAVIDDPYAPLRLYDGKWEVATAGEEKGPAQIENHCVRTGLFFVCEQSVNGKTEGLVVFLPVMTTATGGENYRTQALSPHASPAGVWGMLTIEDNRWTYSWEIFEGEKKIYWRNINVFSGTDQIHFEISRSEDGRSWKPVKSGDERRVK
jgi:hypothetical protein